ncbi:hypothetical protein G7Y79_00030g065110 [Physcia stellaris]|nr:hypothetical protein G7Y79_00030g065110 [Physcia stellaris]
MDPQKLALSLRDSIAVQGAELSIKLFALTLKVKTESELIGLLAHDVSFLSVVLQNLARAMLGTAIFSCQALEKIHRWTNQSENIFNRLTGNTSMAEMLVRGRFGSDDGGIELSESEQEETSLTPPQLTAFRADLSGIKTMLMLAYHLGDLAFDTKAELLREHRLSHNPNNYVLEGSWSQSKIDTILALNKATRTVLNPILGSKQATMDSEDSNHMCPTDITDEIVDLPSTLSESPICVERENAPCSLRYRRPDQKPKLAHRDEEHVYVPGADSGGSHKADRRSVNDRVNTALLPDTENSEALDQMSHASQVGNVPAAPLVHEQPALRNYEMELIFDRQNMVMVRHEPTPSMAQSPLGNHALQDYQIQLMLLEQQNKKRLLLARQAESTPSMAQRQPGNHALQDYQMQLMLLEQANKKRLLSAMQATDSSPVPGHGGSKLCHDPKTALLTQAASEPPRLQIPDVQSSKVINRRTIEILHNHGLKPEQLDPDTVLMLQKGTEQQLERFIQAWNGREGDPQYPTPNSAQRNDDSSPPAWSHYCNNAILTPVPSLLAQNTFPAQSLMDTAYEQIEKHEAAANVKPNKEATKVEELSNKLDRVQRILIQPEEAVQHSQQQAENTQRTLRKIKSEAERQQGLQQRHKRAMQQVQKQQQQIYLKQREMATYRLQQQQQLQSSQAEQRREETWKYDHLVKKQREVHEKIVAERLHESRELEERKEVERQSELPKTVNEATRAVCAFDESDGDDYVIVEYIEEQDEERQEKELVKKQKAGLNIVEALLREYTTLYDPLD